MKNSYFILFFYFKEAAPESDQGQLAVQDGGEISADSGTLQEGKNIEKGKEKEEKDKDKEKTKDPEKEKGKEKDADKKGENEKEKLKILEGTNLDALLQRLPGCVSRDLIDQLTVIISLFELRCSTHILFFWSMKLYVEDLIVYFTSGRILLPKFESKPEKTCEGIV